MATGSSIVGTWNVIMVDWGGGGNPVKAAPFTFNANGTWTYQFGGGKWFQLEGMAAWNFDNAAGLIYTANVTIDAMVGIMGYATATPSKGCFYALRNAPPAALATAAAAAAPGGEAEGADAAVGPQGGGGEKK